jgi:hypothetical protein
VEEYASWRASFRALGEPEDTRIEREMSDGSLRVNVRAYQRELAWAPPYVAMDVGGTSRAAQDAHDDAALLGFWADAADDLAERDRLTQEAAASAQRAEALDRQAAELLAASNIRGEWFMRTLETKQHAERAREDLQLRGVDPDAVEDRVTPQEWLDEHRAELTIEDPHRVVTDTDIAGDHDTLVDDRPEMVVEMPIPDIRERAAVEAPVAANTEDWDRVPDIDTTRAAVDAAARALEEMAQRQAWEADREAEDRAYEVSTWEAADQVRPAAGEPVDVL